MRESDEELYRVYLAEGSEDALRELLLRHRESLTLFLFGYVRNMDDAEELMLDAFAAAAARTSAYAGRSSFRTWLFGIGRHLALRQLKHRREIPQPEPGENGESPELELMRSERNRQLYAAMERLHPDYRQALYLLFFEDMEVGEAARVMGKTKKQVYNLTERGKKALRAELERMGFDYAQRG
jgi:RNA polymerase sigma-70 factor (ECF subfamily)